MTSGCDFLEAERNGNRKAKSSRWKVLGGIPVVEHRTACYNVPAEFAKGLLKRAPFKATHHKKVSRFDEILLGFVLGSSLRGDI